MEENTMFNFSQVVEIYSVTVYNFLSSSPLLLIFNFLSLFSIVLLSLAFLMMRLPNRTVTGTLLFHHLPCLIATWILSKCDDREVLTRPDARLSFLRTYTCIYTCTQEGFGRYTNQLLPEFKLCLHWLTNCPND